MAEFGITPEGFNAKRLRDVLDDLRADLIQIQDPDTGETLQVDFDEADPFIQAINTLADNNAKTWELAQSVVRAFDPSQATDQALSALVQMNGIARRGGLPSTIPISLGGTAGLMIPQGSQITDDAQTVIFATDADYTIDGAGQATGTATAIVNGPFAALANMVTTILTPVAGWNSVTNTADATLGRNTETNAELRARRNRSTETPSVSPVESTFGNLSNLQDVSFARVYQNNTLTTDARGIPAKSLAAVVQGGDDEEIARTLFLRNAGGVGYFGGTSFTITDRQGEQYQIRWIRPTPVDIVVELEITVTDSNVFPSNGADLIEQAIVAYSQQGARALGIEMGFEDTGFVPGVDVTLSRLYTPINSVPGHKIDTLEIAIDGNTPGAADIPIAFNDFASFSSDRITVTVNT